MIAVRLAFALAIGVGALLLFQVQFVVGKTILPWYGGVPAVWSLCLLFFQAMLLAGYGAAHGLTALPPRRQAIVYLLAVSVALLWLAARMAQWPSPLLPPDAWKPAPGGSPNVGILVLLLVAVGPPYLVLSATGPLLQRWWSTLWPERPPYRLYALSNAGSLAGLLTYPLVVERWLPVVAQGWLWTWAFAGYAAAAAVAAVACLRHGEDGRGQAGPALDERRTEPALWFALAAVGAMLLQSTTTWLTLDVAAVPLLWVAPLALYLGTFVVAFAYPHRYRRVPWMGGVLVAVVGSGVVLAEVTPLGAGWSLVTALATLTTACMVCHGELAVRAPSIRHLTRFYLIIAAGGAAGSLVAALVAPRVFTSVLEYPLSLLAVTVLLLVVARPSARDASARASAWTTWALAPAALGVLIVLLMAGEAVRARQQGVVARSRNFFGSVHVMETVTPSGARVRTLIHGTTVHGLQFLDRARDREPTAYYVRTSGVGLVMEALRSSAGEAHVGVVGLGTGTLAAYSRPLDRYRFYEIDPQVVALSQGAAPLFTYLARSGAEVTVVTGDARLGLEREAPQEFDVLVVDAFSSDAVPAHLLTVEAFALYRRHLRDDSSLLLLHISNRFLRLADVVQAGGAAAGFASVLVVDAPDTELARASDWMLLALDPDALRPFAEPGPPLRSAMRPWTDGWASLFDVIRW